MLRLVNTNDAGPHRPGLTRARPTSRAPRSDARSGPGTEPRSAPVSTPKPGHASSDPRWVLAVRTAIELDGGRAAVLTPERRDALNKLAEHLRITPFDAALIIATVQDAARRGEPVPSHDLAHRVTRLRPGVGFTPEPSLKPWIITAVTSAAAVGLAGLLIQWINSA